MIRPSLIKPCHGFKNEDSIEVMLIDKLEEIAKNRGFFWPSQEIYGGVSGFYDYGPLGTLMKKHIEGMILDYYVMEEGCLAIESPVLTTIDPWVASGHVENFADKLIERSDPTSGSICQC